MPERLSHIGICVADLPRSRRFYCDGLGFRERARFESSGDATARLLQLDDVALSALYLERDGVCIELLHFERPGHAGPPEARPMNQLGLTHLSLRVSDLDATAERLREAGGRILPETRIAHPELPVGALFVLDPDGTRIELVKSPGPLDRVPGEPQAS
ncbi:MAG: VOC family protein [Myxococcota bacterium]|nr:VOC family protein [Myxococcota bacterium]